MGHKKPVRVDPFAAALKAGGVDTHAHLDMESFDNDRDQVIDLAAQCGVSQIGNIFLSPTDYRSKKSFFRDHPGVFFLLGIHPHDGMKCTDQCLESMVEAFRSDARLVAVGEIGLDYYYNHCPEELQREAFVRQLEMAKKLDRPIVIHCRDAAEDCLTFLEAGGFKDYPLLWHCFGGDVHLAERIVRNGWHISIPGSVTYPPNQAARDAVAWIPIERLVLETDCPYLSPVPWRGALNQPAYIVFTAREVARERGVDPEELWQACGENARRFFSLDRLGQKENQA